MDNRQFFNLGTRGYEFITNQPLWRAQIARVLDHVEDPSKVRRVLDLGCGWGVSSFVLAEAFPEAEIIGVDIADKMIARAHHHHREHFPHLKNLTFEVGDATALRLDEGEVDFAVGHSFLYLVADRLGVLREILRVLSPGGTLVLMEPHREGNLWQVVQQRRPSSKLSPRRDLGSVSRFALSMVMWRIVSAGRGQWEREELEELFQLAGFALVQTRPTLRGLGLHCIGQKAASP